MISIRTREPIPRKRKKDGCGSIADNAHDKEEDDKKEYFSVTLALKNSHLPLPNSDFQASQAMNYTFY